MTNMREFLKYISPDDYDTWMKVGAALKHEGESIDLYREWSMQSSKYKDGDCEKKWRSFNESTSTIVTGGTIYQLAAEGGYRPEKGEALDIHDLWLDEAIIDTAFVSPESVPKPAKDYDAKGDMLEYLTALFEPNDYVGVCTSFWQDDDGKWKPSGHGQNRTAGDIIDKLKHGSVKKALGTLNEEAGVYVRFNPLDGQGENNRNVTRREYCLIESDTDSVEKQYSILKEMNLPIRFLIHSGGKSLHAIVHVDAANEAQYRERVTKLYQFCKKNGFTPDEQDKNESRYSRLPGVKRGPKWQYIVARNIGAENYVAWEKWAAEQVDDLPQDISLDAVWNNMPPLKEELIPGVLRVGHKMLLAGPSKAGKSFLLINLCISIAEGREWIGLPCKQGRVLYVNLELDENSCFHRFKEIYDKLKITPQHPDCIQIWNLRGHAVPMNRLAPILIQRFKEKRYEAVIIDPIYKVITGDENNATEMAAFCSYFDQVATEMGVSVIYCHHHSKGATGKYANAADRSSGSGVFARDPDAILDLSQVKTDGLEEKYRDAYPDACDELTAWELSGTLREFPPMNFKRLWFDYPIHRIDEFNFLASAGYADAGDRGIGKDQKEKSDWYQIAEDIIDMKVADNCATIEEIGISESSAKRVFSAIKTDWMTAKLQNGMTVVAKQGSEIIYTGNIYRKGTGKNARWQIVGAVEKDGQMRFY